MFIQLQKWKLEVKNMTEEFLEKATRYKLSAAVKKRVLKLLENNKDEDKLVVAMNYVYSITKVGVRGTR